MARNPGELIVVTDAHWMHFSVTRVYHRHYPEVRGEGRSLREALRQLVRLLERGLDRAHGPRREAIERAVVDVRAMLLAVEPVPRPTIAATS